MIKKTSDNSTAAAKVQPAVADVESPSLAEENIITLKELAELHLVYETLVKPMIAAISAKVKAGCRIEQDDNDELRYDLERFVLVNEPSSLAIKKVFDSLGKYAPQETASTETEEGNG